MIEKGMYDNFGKQQEYISINLSDKHHKNRTVDIFEKKDLLTGAFQFDIKAQWTNEQYHPTMLMNEKDFLDFVSKLNEWATKIRARQANSN